jgi:hypothetical protein
MADTRTQPTPADVAVFLDAVEPPRRQADGKALCALFHRITGEEPRMWGPSIVGFGSYGYRYDSGHEGTACRLGFSPRKAQLVLYVLVGAAGEPDRLARLGRHKAGKGCLYVNKLADVDMAVLEALIRAAWDEMNAKYPPG